MLHIGIIGAGEFGAQHAKAIAQLSSVMVTAASRTNKNALDKFSKQFDCKGYTNYQDLLRDPNVDAVVIATPHHLHTPIVKAAASAGKHILLEKPMAPTLAECDQILRATRQSRVSLMLGHINHFVPAYAKAKEILESGELGDIVYGHSLMAKPWLNPNRRDWHLDRRKGGGMWMTIGVHVLDQLCWLLDSPVSSIAAVIGTKFHQQDADDTGVALLRFEKGVSATATSIGYKTGVFNFTTELTCTKGMLKISHSEGVFIGRNETWQQVEGTASANWMEEAMTNEWKAFSSALEHNQPMPVTGEFARQVMQVAFAAESSSKEKREIHL